MTTNAGKRTPATTRPPTTTGSFQPTRPPLETASTRPVSPATNVVTPAASSPRTESGLESSRSTTAPQAAAARPSGTLNQKTHCQEMDTSAPPSTGPSTRPIAATIVFVPMASPSWRLGKGVGDQRGGVREQERGADALEDAPHDQLRAVAREARAQRGQREGQEAAEVGLLAAEEIREPAGGEHEDRRGDHVGEDHPHEAEQARVERALEVGQGDDQRAGVRGREQHPDARAGERPPLVVRVAGVDAGAPAPGVFGRSGRNAHSCKS